MTRFALCGHVRACETNAGIIFLDLRRNRYFGVPASQASALKRWVCNWPGEDGYSPSVEERLDTDVSGLNPLLEAGLLRPASSCEPQEGHPLDLPLSTWVGLAAGTKAPAVGMEQIARVIYSVLLAKSLLKRTSFERIQQRVGGRRLAACIGDWVAESDTSVAQATARVFCRVRPWLYSARGACLLDSLAMAEFLSGYGIYPHWVVGVQAKPFRAHSWLQWGAAVLNDTVESVKQFEPILVA